MLYFYSKNGHNVVENDHTGKKITLVLKTTYKVFLKYQVNARFPSLCLVSENAISGGRKKEEEEKKKKKKSRQAHWGSVNKCPNKYTYIHVTCYNMTESDINMPST